MKLITGIGPFAVKNDGSEDFKKVMEEVINEIVRAGFRIKDGVYYGVTSEGTANYWFSKPSVPILSVSQVKELMSGGIKDCSALAKRLIELRVSFGYTVKEVSEQTGIDLGYLKRLEDGVLVNTASTNAVYKLASFYKIDFKELAILGNIIIPKEKELMSEKKDLHDLLIDLIRDAREYSKDTSATKEKIIKLFASKAPEERGGEDTVEYWRNLADQYYTEARHATQELDKLKEVSAKQDEQLTNIEAHFSIHRIDF